MEASLIGSGEVEAPCAVEVVLLSPSPIRLSMQLQKAFHRGWFFVRKDGSS
jgi:hypothetical protein